MLEHQIGRIAAIIIGGIAGWLAEQFMKSQMGPAALALATTNIPRSRESPLELITEAVNRIMPSILLLLIRLTQLGCPRDIV